ncbi:MAG: hypothetical protein FJY19_07845 [Bacteroidetes bacterium]|nr:hypothetical protein [Bacteroidota bacterium]
MNENSFLSFAMLFSAALVFFINYLKRKKAIVRSKFPTASGIIHDVHLKEYRDSRYDDDTGQSETRITYHPHIKYKYEIEGKIYEGNRKATPSG